MRDQGERISHEEWALHMSYKFGISEKNIVVHFKRVV